MAMHAPATGLIAASACHRTALAQREALSSLPSGAPGAAGSASLRRDALMRRRTALLALRSQACAAREATPSVETSRLHRSSIEVQVLVTCLMCAICERAPCASMTPHRRPTNVTIEQGAQSAASASGSVCSAFHLYCRPRHGMGIGQEATLARAQCSQPQRVGFEHGALVHGLMPRGVS